MTAEWIVCVSVYSLAWFIVGLVCGQRIKLNGKRAARPGREAKPSRRPAVNGNGGRVELYIGNLPYDMKEKELRKCFEAYGQVDSVRIIGNKFSGKSKGYGFIEMANRAGAQAAVKAMSGKELSGRRIVVNEAKSQARD